MKPDIAMAHLERILADIPDEGTILEWGSGGSTVFFAENKPEAARLVTIENDRTWWDKVMAEVYDQPATYLWLHEPEHGLRSIGGYGTHLRENPTGQASYICNLNIREVIREADVIFVDGTARGACLATAAKLKKPECTVYLHDAERGWYDWAIPLFSFTELLPPESGHPGSLRRFI